MRKLRIFDISLFAITIEKIKALTMNYFNTEEIRIEEGVYMNYHNGYFTFRFSFDELVVFEEVKTEVLEAFDLRSEKYIGTTFMVTYKEIINDLDDEDFLTFRLLKLERI
jgi:hypothetical protein